MKERRPISQTQGLTEGQITESPISLTEVMQAANLKPNELQIVQLVHHAAEEGKDVSRRDITEHLYPEENFQVASIKVGGDLQGANSKLSPFGWKIDHPVHFSQGKVRKIRNRYIITRQDEVLETQPSKSGKKHEALGKKHNPNNRVIKEPSRESILTLPTLPRTQEIKPLPSTALYDSQGTRKREETEKLEELRQKFKLDITLSILSLIKLDEMRELKKIAKELSNRDFPDGISFDSVVGIDPKEDKETKERKKKEFVVTAVNEALDRLWGKQLQLVTIPKDRQILTRCMELEETGKTIQDVKNAVSENFGVDLPEGINLTSSPALKFPEDTIHS